MGVRKLGKRLVSLALAAVVVIAVLSAVLNPGVPAKEVDLHDAGVWVTNSNLQMVAHLNPASRSLDAAVRVDTKAVDVFQNGEQVQVLDLDTAALSQVDVARARLGGAMAYSGMETAVGGEVAAFTRVAEGAVWRQRISQLVPIQDSEPDISGLPGAITTVGNDGGVHAVSASAARVVSLAADAAPDKAQGRDLAGLSAQANLQIAAVGSQAVVLDRSSATLHLPSGATVELDASDLELQESGPAAQSVLVASAAGLLEVPLDGGSPKFTPATHPGGSPARPVRLGSCAYSAWTGVGAFVKDCDQDHEDVNIAVQTLSQVQHTRFRVNRSTIVLNDLDSGSLWLPNEMMLLVDDWDQVNSTLESEEESGEDSADQANDVADPERSEENTPPVAVEDSFGVRAGRSNVLPVLQNDSDADGDYLTVTQVTETSLGTLAITRDGGAIQITVPEGATGSAVFEYEISDGRGGVARTQAVLTVHEDSVNSAPKQLIPPALSLGSGRSATVNALANWYDPDGDPFYLSGVNGPNGLSVRYRELGSVDVTENGAEPGEYQVALQVSDGRDIGDGRLDVTVRDEGNLPPTTNTDHVVVSKDTAVTATPLDNDTDPNGDPLRLVQIDGSAEGIEASIDGNLGTVSVTGRTLGTYYLSYLVTDGPTTSTGYIRVDVVEPEQDKPPTAEEDIGVLPLGSQAFVDLLANDYDSGGGVLTVSHFDVPADSELSVALLHRQIVRVTAHNGLSAPASFTYTVTNGVATATATVTVLPGPPVVTTTGPELNDDKVVVRSGDVVNVSVLDNDRSPVGLNLSLDGNLQYDIDESVATVFKSENVIRIRGGESAGSGAIVYTVRDSGGNVASAVVEFTVIPIDEESNTAPRPRNLVARTSGGHKVDIPVPLDGIDREGDSVVLLGIASSPTMGNVEVKGNSFSYTAAASAAGTDSFNYLVEDRLGRQATGTVRVGISPAAQLNQNPVTTPDEVAVRPGMRVAVAVLTNDTDPDGERIALDPESIRDNGAGLNVGHRGSRITLTAPETEGTHIVTYAVTDGVGGRAEGVLTVVVDADAVLKAPIARDDALTQDQITQGRADGRVVIQVLDNDEDPDGDINDVIISSQDPTMTVLGGGHVEIELLPSPQIVIYTITDPDGLSSSAVIRVPSLDQSRPVLNTENTPIRVTAGEQLTIPINDYVVARDSRQVMLTSESTVSAGVGADGSNLVIDRSTLAFRSTPEFSGATAITFEVTDGQSLNDPDGRTAVITLPIVVVSNQNHPPVFRPTAVELGRGESLTVDLAPMAQDPDEDALSFAVSGTLPTGITAEVSGTRLSIQASTEAAPGAGSQIPITVDDGRGGSVQAGIPVTVTDAANVPLLRLSNANVTIEPGGSVSLDILNHAVSEAGADGPVRIVGTPSVTTGGSATVSGTTITLRAEAGFTGSFTATYVAVDGDGAANRQVTGVVTASVLGRPSPPVAVSASAISPTTARVSWISGAANGSPITGFTVTDHTQGDSVQCGLATSCLIGGRTPGSNHVFSVTATNSVGTSDASATAQVMLDLVPQAPAAPTVVAGDGSVEVSWNPPANQGSAILYYEVRLSPGFTSTVPATGSGTRSTRFTGLTNGAEYVATVRAVNAQGASEWSQGSATARPFGAPSRVRDVSAQMTASFGQNSGTVRVTWTAPADNGRPIEYYTVTVGSVSKRVPAAAGNTALLEGITLDGRQHSVTVTATNDSANPASHTSPPGTSSVWAVGLPHPPIIHSVAATGVDQQVRLNWSPSPQGGGWGGGDLSYEWSAGQGWRPLSGDLVSGNGLVNGVASTISIRAVGSKTGSVVTSSSATSSQVTPYGPPVASTMTCTPQAGAVTCSWSGGHGNGRGVRFSLSGAASGTVEASGSRTFNVAPGTEVELCVATTQEGTGTTAPTQCAKATALKTSTDSPVQITTNGLTVTMTLTEFEFAGSYSFKCWNATSWVSATPNNFLGDNLEGIMEVPRNGTITFTCAGNPDDPALRPSHRFGVQFMPLGVFYS